MLDLSKNHVVIPTTPLAPYRGGKRLLASAIIARIDAIPHKTYAEPFGGMGGVFLRRSKRPSCEVFNDLNRDVANLFRIARRHPEALSEELRYQHKSRTDFERFRKTDPEMLTDIERAARFLFLQKCGFGGLMTWYSIGVQRDRRPSFQHSEVVAALDGFSRRLEETVIEALPYQELIQRYDGPNTLFYLDPPYWESEEDYGRGMFSKDDFAALAEILGSLRGRFLMSLNAHGPVREIFSQFEFECVETSYSSGRAGGTRVEEYIISN